MYYNNIINFIGRINSLSKDDEKFATVTSLVIALIWWWRLTALPDSASIIL